MLSFRVVPHYSTFRFRAFYLYHKSVRLAASEVEARGLLFNPNNRPFHCSSILNTSSRTYGKNLSKTEIKESTLSSKEALKSTEWITIYRFPYIVPARLFSRFKFYVTCTSVMLLPFVAHGLYNGTMPLLDALTFVSISTFSIVLMYCFGELFRRLIGSVYVSPDEHLVRISHLTFFGNRSETIVGKDELMLLSDFNLNLNDYLLQVRRIDQSSKNMLFICLRYGGILDRDRFEDVFGKKPRGFSEHAGAPRFLVDLLVFVLVSSILMLLNLRPKYNL